jgi:hypothetical protein
MQEPLSPTDAKQALLRILEEGIIVFSKHAREEMAKDDLDDQDALNVLRGGVVEPAEFENGSYRYRVRTSRMYFVVAFRSDNEARVVTAWRTR